jgi:hypothetical protein
MKKLLPCTFLLALGLMASSALAQLLNPWQKNGFPSGKWTLTGGAETAPGTITCTFTKPTAQNRPGRAVKEFKSPLPSAAVMAPNKQCLTFFTPQTATAKALQDRGFQFIPLEAANDAN